MFGITTKKQLLESERFVNSQLTEFNIIVSSLNEEVKTLRKELHACQSSLYKLIDKLNYDLELNEKGEIVIRQRTMKS